MLTEEQLVAIGVNPKNLVYPKGEMNIIVQCFGSDKPIDSVYPDIYHPRKNSIWSCGEQNNGISIDDDANKKIWIEHLKDSAERLKIMSYYLMKQAEEIETFGYPKTNCYYPE